MGAIGKSNKSCRQRNLRETKQQKNEEWLYVECAAYIREKNNVRRKMIKKETRTNYEGYQEWRRKTNRICTGKKRENMKKQLEVINQ
jgi:hypothetical protein